MDRAQDELEILIKEDESVDDTGFAGIRVIQGSGFRYGIDAVLLASFCAGELSGCNRDGRLGRVADLGTGNAIVPLILSHKLPTSKFVGIEFDEDACDRAARSIQLNGLSDRVRLVEADIKDVYNSIVLDKLKEGRSDIEGAFDAVVSNPPYFRQEDGIVNPDEDLARARHESTAGLNDFLALAELLLKKNGDLYMVHRAQRMVDVLSGIREFGMEPKELLMVAPRAGEAANIILVRAVKGAGRGLTVLPELYVRDGDSYTDDIERIYERETVMLEQS